MAFETAFGSLFEGNPAAHYTRAGGQYQVVERGITEEDLARHLRGVEPSLLSIPILPDGNCHFGALDVDRHEDTDEAVDHAALARRVTELGLPLVVCRSKNPRSAHLWLFLKERYGFPAGVIRRLLARYRQVLAIPGEVDVFPRQEALKEGQVGNGINLPLFGAEREAYGRSGERLDLAGFIALAQERQVFGQLLTSRDLVAEPEVAPETGKVERPLPLGVIRDLHLKNLAALRAARPGTRNDTLNTVCFFAGRAFAAGALEGAEQAIKDVIRQAAEAAGMGGREIEVTGASGWSSGVVSPLQVLDTQKQHDEAVTWLDMWRDGKYETATSEEVIDKAAILVPMELEDRRDAIIKKLGWKRPTVFDKEVARRQPRDSAYAEQNQGSVLTIENVLPWHEPVSGAVMLSELSDTFRRYVVFQNATDADVLALWTTATYCYDQFDILPYLAVVAPSKECGKTTALEVLLQFAARAVPASNISGAAVYRIIELYRPTLFVDELDSVLGDEKNKELVGILNAGHKRAFAYVLRCVGEDKEVRKFNCFGPKAYGMIGKPPGTMFSRSIIISLLRKQPDERLEKFNIRWLPVETVEAFARLRRQLTRWVQDHLEPLQKTRPNTVGLANRTEDNWEPLLVIAELAGGDWTKRAHKAVAVPGIRDEESELDILLRDIHNIFHTRKVDRIPSTVLLADLLHQAESPWLRYGRSEKELNLHLLGRRLAEMNIRAQVLRFGKQDTMFESGLRRGFTLVQFQNLFNRQLAGTEPVIVELSQQEPTF